MKNWIEKIDEIAALFRNPIKQNDLTLYSRFYPLSFTLSSIVIRNSFFYRFPRVRFFSGKLIFYCDFNSARKMLNKRYFPRRKIQTFIVRECIKIDVVPEEGKAREADKARTKKSCSRRVGQNKRSASVAFTSCERENVTSHLATLHIPSPGYPDPLLRKIWSQFP